MSDFNHKEYLRGALEDEQFWLKRSNTPISPDQKGYSNIRDRIVPWVIPLIDNILTDKGQVKVLEIGGGKGFAIDEIHSFFADKPNQSVTLTMTSLNPLPEYKILRQKGIQVFTGIIAEELPRLWTDKFDLVYTDSLFGWTNMRLALPEVFRVLVRGGQWMGFEDADQIYDIGQSTPEIINRQLSDLGLKNEFSLKNIQSIRSLEPALAWVYPFKCTKA
jgi:hypothetical protein